MGNDATGDKKPWLAYLGEEYLSCEKGTVEHDIASILKGMLLSSEDDDGKDAARTAAHQFNDYYWEKNLESGSLLRYQKDDSYDFVGTLFNAIVGVARFVPYNDARQDILVCLILEIRRLPPKPVKSWNGHRLMEPNSSLFAETLDESWCGYFPGDIKHSTLSLPEWKKACNEWVNITSFVARCLQARTDDYAPDQCKYPHNDIPTGLEHANPGGIQRDSRDLIAAQYILLAGQVIDEEMVQKPMREEGSSWGLDKWLLWAAKFKELAEGELATDVKTAAIEARESMISLHPELFFVSEGGSKPDD